ncbi:MAG: IclR family transcriptional regulator [Armatimonadota bacterium]|nr:IclR family transcriptional regulator [Armatimonadota bacterium]MDW8157014.1 IclR family transcriptional regulator [Armatimonadota bacterium]
MRNDVPHRGTQAVARALDVLWAFAEGGAMGVSELSRRIALPKSTVHRLLEPLVARDLVVQDPATGRYRLGPGVFRLGSAFAKSLDVRQAALPAMHELARRTGETVNLNIRQGAYRVCVEKVDSVQDVRHFVELGRPLPLFAGASGKVLLAYADTDVLAAVLRGLRPLTGRTVTDPDRLQAQLARIRRQGYAVSWNERVEGAAAVSAPVRDAAGTVVAGLTVSGPTYRFSATRIRELVPMVVEAAAEVSSRLGYSPGGTNAGARPMHGAPGSTVRSAAGQRVRGAAAEGTRGRR